MRDLGYKEILAFESKGRDLSLREFLLSCDEGLKLTREVGRLFKHKV